MTYPESIDERRRRAPLHFFAKADNARYCAWSLWTLIQSEAFPDIARARYGGSPWVALSEGWRRERSLALECIIKAVIAQREEAKAEPRTVRATHNVSALWDEAQLPRIGRDDRIRLLMTWQLLQWAGRYAAPNVGSDGQRSALAQVMKRSDSLLLHQPEFGWTEFDALYQKALTAFYEARAALYPE